MRQLCHWSIFTPVTSDKGPVTILQLHAPLPQHPFDGIGEAGGIQIHPETGIGPDDFLVSATWRYTGFLPWKAANMPPAAAGPPGCSSPARCGDGLLWLLPGGAPPGWQRSWPAPRPASGCPGSSRSVPCRCWPGWRHRPGERRSPSGCRSGLPAQRRPSGPRFGGAEPEIGDDASHGNPFPILVVFLRAADQGVSRRRAFR